jgi:hypothetical protein
VVLAIMGVSLLVLAYAIDGRLIDLAPPCTGLVPCPLYSPVPTVMGLVSLGAFLLVFVLLVWLLRDRISSGSLQNLYKVGVMKLASAEEALKA